MKPEGGGFYHTSGVTSRRQRLVGFSPLLLTSLLLVGHPARVEADVIEFTGYFFGNRYETQVLGSGFVLEKELPANTTLFFDIELDQVKEPPIEAGETRTIDGISGASRPARLPWEDSDTRELNRGQIIAGFKKGLWDNTEVGLSGYTSQEVDYDSKAIAGSIQQEFAQKNFTVSLSGQYGFDKIGFLNPAGITWNNRETQRGDLSLRQLLSPTAYLTLGFYGEVWKGFLSNPYRILATDPQTVYERHPESRYRSAAYIKLGKYFKMIDGSTLLTYRYYQDDWEIQSHTAQLRLNKYVTRNSFLSATMRHYTQTAAYFHTQDVSQAFYSGDEKLSAFQAQTFALHLHWSLRGLATTFEDLSFFRGAQLILGYNRYFNDVEYSSNIFEYKLRFQF